MGTGSFPGVERPGRGLDHPLPSSAEVDGRVELYICSSGPSWPVIGRPLPLPMKNYSKLLALCIYTLEVRGSNHGQCEDHPD